MSFQFLNFEDTHIKIGGKTMYAISASMQIQPQIGADRVYGNFNREIAGTETKLHRQAALGPIEGSLDVTFYLTTDFFTGLEPDSIFDVENVTEKPIKNNRIGRYILGDLYLTKFSFKLKPFNVVEATASYFMSGTLSQDRPSYRIPLSQMESFDPVHALRCFAVMTSAGKNMVDIADIGESAYVFEITDLDYRINVERNKRALIRTNENTIINTRPDGAKYNRVSVNNMESSMQISSNDLVDRLNPYGDRQELHALPAHGGSAISAYLYTINGSRLAQFSCEGKVVDQSLTVNKDGMTTANITVKEIIR